MAPKKTDSKKKEEPGENKPKPGRRRRSQAVKELVEKVEEKLTKGLEKATLADYIRLIQLQKELEENEPKEVKVTWEDPAKRNSDG